MNPTLMETGCPDIAARKRRRFKDVFNRPGLFHASWRGRNLPLLAVALTLAMPLLTAAQSASVRPRVTDRIDTSRMMTLAGSTHPLAQAQYDQGAAPPDLPMNRMLFGVETQVPTIEAALQTFA